MKIGIGLPTTLDLDGAAMLTWARSAEEHGFSTLATLDRIVYPNYESLISLGVAAGATSRIELMTNILVSTLYQPVWLAKATATLNTLSGGRFTLGVGVGGRADDFEAMNRPFGQRGQLMDEQLDVLTRAWAGELVAGDEFSVVPEAAIGHRPQLLVGGGAEIAFERAATYGDGWTVGGGGPQAAGQGAAKARAAWTSAGHEGEPRLVALAYFGLGDQEATDASLRRYYGFAGPYADLVAANALTSPEKVRTAVGAYEEAGFDELILNATVADGAEVARLAEVVL